MLWTGGWDSTFRLLQLLLQHRATVVPHYLTDSTRASTRTELRTMARIRAALAQAHPHTRALLQPLRVAAVDDIAADPALLAALAAIRARLYIGDQYAWLPAYRLHQGLEAMELCVHVDDKVQALLQPLAQGFEHPAGFASTRVDPMHVGSPEHALFGGFSFPLFDIDKRGMERAAAAAGWGALMEMTWFCHAPRQGRPCGLCAPCIYTIEEGLGRRVPRARRVVSAFYRYLVWPLRSRLRQWRASARRWPGGTSKQDVRPQAQG